MTTRILPCEEWPRLMGTDAEAIWPTLDPMRSAIVVVEHDGVIIAHHILLYVLHAEALWVHPAHRKGIVGGRLWAAVKSAVRGSGARGFVTAAVDDDVRRLIAKVGGTPLPGSHFTVTVEDRCQLQ